MPRVPSEKLGRGPALALDWARRHAPSKYARTKMLRRKGKPSGRAVLALAFVGTAVAVGLFAFLRGGAPEPGFHIYVLGGSTARGEPYQSIDSFAAMFHQLFGGAVGAEPLFVKNVALPGVSSDLVREAAEAIPSSADVVFLYVGNNEFLRRDVDNDLSVQERRRFDVALVSAEERSAILRGFERNVTAIVTGLRAKGIPVALSTVAVNLAEWSPNRSLLADASNAAQLEALLERAGRELSEGATEAAHATLTAALELEPEFAETHARLGDVLRREGRTDEAYEHYVRAADLDGNPQRAFSSQNAFLRAFAAETEGVALVDAVAIVRAASPNGLPGYDAFWDNCHPRLATYYRIAVGGARAMAEMLDIEAPLRILADDELDAALGVTSDIERRILHSRGRYLYRCAALSWNARERTDRALHYFDAAAAIERTADLSVSVGIAHVIAGDVDDAVRSWRSAFEQDAEIARERLAHPTVQALLQRHDLERTVAGLSEASDEERGDG